MKRQSSSSSSHINRLSLDIGGGGSSGGGGGGFSSVTLFDGEGEAVVVANKLRDNLRSMAIELTSVRQV